MMKIEYIAEQFLSAKNEEDLLSVFGNSLEHNGFDNYAISTVTPHGPEMIGFNLSQEWGEYYTDREYWKIDPVFDSMRTNWKPHVWKDLVSEETPKDVQDFMAEADDCGLKHGHTISLQHLGRKMNLAISSSERLAQDAERSMIAKSFALSSMFAAKRTILQREKVSLQFSPRELEVTKWIVAGKTNQEVADAMNISKKTVEEFIRRICIKNNFSNRLEISLFAVMNGLVDIS